MTLHLDTLRRLYGLSPDDGVRALVRGARSFAQSHTPLAISAAAAAGVPMGSGSRDELHRAHLRAAGYAELFDAMADAADIRTIKGPSLAAYYPESVVRPVGDLDVIAASEADLWAAARVVCARRDVDTIDLSLIPHADQKHVQLGLLWPTDDPMLERDHNIEIGTLPYAGDFGTVPAIPELPSDPRLADLLALAEERFQRPYSPKDILDVRFLLERTELDPVVTARLIAGHRRAPELVELLELARPHASAPELTGLLEALREPAAHERALRENTPITRSDPQPVDVRERLDEGLPVYGMALRPDPPQDRSGWRAARHEVVDGSHLLCTPIGDYLLVGEATVSHESYSAAMAALTRIEG
ncbi:hypothetical protein [Streptomyces coffeae]|uniref:Nucleotidyltransferase family protein n=1 Tax=Streptomyces coffeae TaxID=621382 RepID=A0ABS1ND12_9ACTN|nr:hypothetical protein [Streptomyces coffeae]MBL1097948.1 hypothetical protein [Streptomyces coffeae]